MIFLSVYEVSYTFRVYELSYTVKGIAETGRLDVWADYRCAIKSTESQEVRAMSDPRQDLIARLMSLKDTIPRLVGTTNPLEFADLARRIGPDVRDAHHLIELCKQRGLI
ncbi:hypothetical protein [Nonomuraea ceibae]|uniref:hypothetical protein n=1 Tax=Nonomuraea ceibae TaxID=1935170 RepID=UPI001C5EBB6C|nr:hypothetical protein [Nonomuraea ceibae]